MHKFDFYEFTGILLPGSILIFGTALLFPEFGSVVLSQDVSVGDLGIFIILSYAGGHVIQAAGNLIESLWWKCFRGMPTDWVRQNKGKLLSSAQRDRLAVVIPFTLELSLPDALSEMTAREWYNTTRQIYAAVAAAGQAERVDRFNGNYGLNRGIGAALVALAALTLMIDLAEFGRALLLLGVAVVALYRMHRFGRHYARELFVQFLQMTHTNRRENIT